MSEVKWIKITTTMFEDEKIDFIGSLPDADSLLIIWIKLLTMAGKCNANGYIFLTENIPYTDEMLAHKFRRPLNTVRLAIETFNKLNMIEADNKGIYITNWGKHQNIEGLEKIRTQTRERVQRYREAKKLSAPCNVTSNATVTRSNETDIEIDKEKEKNYIPHQKIVDIYHTLCPALPKVKIITASRKKHIGARWKQLKCNLDAFTEYFTAVGKSEFLKGNNNHKWKATFDWLMNEQNMAKVLEGQYENKTEPEAQQTTKTRIR